MFVGKPKGMRPLGKSMRRWEDNIRMDHREIWWEDVDWMHLDQDKDHWRGLVNAVMNLASSIKAGNFLANWVTT